MKKQTMGAAIASLRKEQGMTQLELADKMGVTDKAVSKWERDLACPDVNSLPKLAQLLNVSVDELMNCQTGTKAQKEPEQLAELICKGVSLAMGVAVVVLSLLGQLDAGSGFGMLGVGLVSISVLQFIRK